VFRTNVLRNAIPREPVYSNLEMDTHAETCVLGLNFTILHYTGRECDVAPYTEVYESVKAVPIVSGATAWTDEGTGLTYILVIIEGLWMADTVAASLINQINFEFTAQRCKIPFGGKMFVKDTDDFVMIPMCAEGTNICIKTRTPTQEELDSCHPIHLTSDREWEPNDIKFLEIAAVHRDVNVFRRDNREGFAQGELYNVDSFRRRLIASCRVTTPRIASVVRDVHAPSTFQTEKRRSGVTPEDLADR
jgi:hypothetical protein